MHAGVVGPTRAVYTLERRGHRGQRRVLLIEGAWALANGAARHGKLRCARPDELLQRRPAA
eukprot:scaffold97483_cov58-Phaeocystis_antarctica.AAC.2